MLSIISKIRRSVAYDTSVHPYRVATVFCKDYPVRALYDKLLPNAPRILSAEFMFIDESSGHLISEHLKQVYGISTW